MGRDKDLGKTVDVLKCEWVVGVMWDIGGLSWDIGNIFDIKKINKINLCAIIRLIRVLVSAVWAWATVWRFFSAVVWIVGGRVWGWIVSA